MKSDTRAGRVRVTIWVSIIPSFSFNQGRSPKMSSHFKGSAANNETPNSPRQQVTSAPTAPHTEKAFFGALKQDAPRQQHPVFSDDYEERFAEDPYCQETAPNARVWRTYVEEAAAFDAVMVGQSRDGLDVMLVFVCFPWF